MNKKKWVDVLSFSALVLMLILVNLNADRLSFRFDLTQEKRFSIEPATVRLLQNLEDNVYIEVYLEGELNAEFRRLQKAIKERLDEFKARSQGLLDYRFVDPNSASNPQARQRFYQQLVERGLPPTSLVDVVDGEQKQKIIFPGAIISYQGKEEPVLLLKGNKAANEHQQLNQSIEGLEYELATAVQKLSMTAKKRIAFVQGHQELRPVELQDLNKDLQEVYEVDFLQLGTQDLQNYHAVIVAQPKTSFSDLDKFDLDQYLMKGGNLLFLLDKVQMNLDSIPKGGTYAFGYDLNIEDLLFRYGVRVNTDLVQDLQSGNVDVYVGQRGNQPNVRSLRWPYFPYFFNFSGHPIVRNLDVLLGKFASTIDTVAAPGIRKTPLIFTSQYSRKKAVPSMVSFNEMKEFNDQAKFNQSFLPVSYLLEGNFRSYFATRFPPSSALSKKVIKEGKSAKILVLADGDLVRNELNRKTGQPEPIDYDKHRQLPLSNKEFVLNALAYMTDEDGLINSRVKQVQLRLLDEIKVREGKMFWQLLNIALPILLVIGFGVVRFYLRKRKYEK